MSFDLHNEVMHLGKQCAVEITGFSEDAIDITSPQQALVAIRECLRLGKAARNELIYAKYSLRLPRNK